MRLIGGARTEDRAPTVAMELKTPGEDVARALAPKGIMAGGGDFYALRALKAMGVDPDHGVLRVSFTHYTSAAEVETLMEALDQVL